MKKFNFWFFLLILFFFLLFLLTALGITKLIIKRPDFYQVVKEEEGSFFTYDTLDLPFLKEDYLPLKGYIIINKNFIFDNEIKILEKILKELLGFEYQIIDEKDFEKLNEKGIIILLEKTEYDVKISEKIKERVYLGWGILIIKNPKTKEGISLLSHIAGVIPIENSRIEYQEVFLKGKTPLTFNMKAGDFLGIFGERSYFLKPVEKRANICGYYKFSDEAIVYGFYNKGRYVAFGFSLNSLTSDSFTQKNIKILFKNIINWLTKRPVVLLSYWPENKEYAFIFSCDVEHQSENWHKIREIVKDGTFFFLTTELKEFDKEEIENIEIALHGEEHEPLKGKDYKKQEEIIFKGKNYLEKKLKKKIFGFHPPLLMYDSLTLAVLKKFQFLYLLTEYQLGLPFLPYFSSIISIPQTIPDDYDLMIRNRIKDKDSLLIYFMKYIEDLKRINGLIVFSIHTHLLGSKDYQSVIKEIIDLIESDKNCYFAKAKDIAQWWLKRSKIKIELKENGLDEITIENLNSDNMEEIILIYYPPTNEVFEKIITIPIKNLRSKEKRKIIITYKNS
ncbi:MAG: hypothetical protein NZ608_00440 [candidate division WOR-3 bacterium]|nr:hypothetical protein [candidate division WOR-3 bacterium]